LLFFFPALLVMFALPKSAFGQIFKLEAGTSSLYQAHGGSIGFHTQKYDGWVGAGSMDGSVEFGAFMRTKWRNSILTFGDDSIPFRLGTDVFDTGHYFMGRGIGVLQRRGATRFFAFVGATSRGTGTPYFRAGEAEKGVGLLFLDHRLTPKINLFSRNVFSSQQSSIAGLEWQMRTGMRAAVSGGIGANQGYGAASFTIDRDLYTIKAAYIRAGDRFGRITVQTPISSEVEKENVMFTLRPTTSLAFSVGRQNFLTPFTKDSPTVRGSVNQYSATYNPGRMSLSGTLFDSRTLGMASRGASFSAGTDVFSRLRVTGNYLWNRAGDYPAYSSVVGTFRETVSPRVSLLQAVNYSAGQTNVSFGGNFVSNHLTVGVEYQTLFLPFLVGNQFRQALVLNFQFRPFGNYSFNVGSYVTADGKVRYTAYGGTYMYRGALGGAPGAVTAVTIYKYLVQGRVVDETGKPIRGAALRIDGDVVFSDSDGVFISRRRRGGMVSLEVLLDQFITTGKFEVVTAPSPVKAEPEDAAHAITIVLRRLAAARGINQNGINYIAEKQAPIESHPPNRRTDLPSAPATITELPLIRNLTFRLPSITECERISEISQFATQGELTVRSNLPMGLGEGPEGPGRQRSVPLREGTKSVQGASLHTSSLDAGGRRSGTRSSRVKYRLRQSRRARARVVRADSRSSAPRTSRGRKPGLRAKGVARGPQLAVAPRKDLSGRLRTRG
jgi:hypothetical protein